MNFDILGDNEYFITQIDERNRGTDFFYSTISIKPTEKLLNILKYVENQMQKTTEKENT